MWTCQTQWCSNYRCWSTQLHVSYRVEVVSVLSQTLSETIFTGYLLNNVFTSKLQLSSTSLSMDSHPATSQNWLSRRPPCHAEWDSAQLLDQLWSFQDIGPNSLSAPLLSRDLPYGTACHKTSVMHQRSVYSAAVLRSIYLNLLILCKALSRSSTH